MPRIPLLTTAFVLLLAGLLLAQTPAAAAPASATIWPFGARPSSRLKRQSQFMPIYTTYGPRWHKKGRGRLAAFFYRRRSVAARQKGGAGRPAHAPRRGRRHVFGLF